LWRSNTGRDVRRCVVEHERNAVERQWHVKKEDEAMTLILVRFLQGGTA